MSLRDRRSSLALAGGLGIVEVLKVTAGWSGHPSWLQMALSALVFGGVSASVLTVETTAAVKKMPLSGAMLQIAWRPAA